MHHLALGHHGRSAEQQQQFREARRLLKESVRNDWDYPALPAYRTHREAKDARADEDGGVVAAGFRFHAGSTPGLQDGDVRGIVGWRERYYGSSQSDDDDDGDDNLARNDGRKDDGDDGETSDRTAAAGRKTAKSKAKKSDYMFEDPNSVGAEISSRNTARKRKRQRTLDEETAWNEGLRHWTAQRDAWSGAKPPTQRAGLVRAASGTDSGSGRDAASAASLGSSPRSSTSTQSEATGSTQPSTATTSPDPAAMRLAHAQAHTPAPPASDLLIPVIAPILPNHPVRKKIAPSLYAEIYTKIIAQSRTPSVPINLANLTRALVQGWKVDGEWPPKVGVPEASIGRRKRGSVGGLRESVRAVTRALKMSSGDGNGAAKEKKEKKGG